MNKIVTIEKIEKIIPLYKNGELANSIECVNLYDLGYTIVVQKGLYKINDSVVMIQPDYCLSEIKLFESFVAPGGDPKRSRLGKNHRIRAIKFNFTLEGSTEPIYSYGILMPYDEVKTYLRVSDEDMHTKDLAEMLDVTKYEEPEKAGSGLVKGNFPSFMYKTDETNICNAKSAVNKIYDAGEELSITRKIDGSSLTLYVKKVDGEFIYGICSRGQEKSLEQKYVTAHFDTDGNEYTRYINPDNKEKGWFCHETGVFKTEEEVKDFKAMEQEVNDGWVDVIHNNNIHTLLLDYCKKYDVELALRGELSTKGSGNRLNPDISNKLKVTFFGIDNLSNGFSIRLNYSDEHNLKKVCDELNLDYTEELFSGVYSYDDIIKLGDQYFNHLIQTENKYVEGIVIRTKYSNNLSVKYLSSIYDSKK